MKRLAVFVVILAALAAGAYAAFALSPWPSVLLIRYTFDRDAELRNHALKKHLPAAVTEMRDLRYGDGADETLDVFLPAETADGANRPLPAVVWIHGGAFVAGSKAHVASYLKILAARGYAAIGIGYSLAPGGRYPQPLHQANAALAYLVENAARLRLDTGRLFLAGDSAGAQIAAQLAAAISNPAYAAELAITPAIRRTGLRGAILFCGVYDATRIDTEGYFGGFIRTVMWSYFGNRDFMHDPRLGEFSVNRHLTPDFPPAFVSVGNADPLAQQSTLIAEAISAQGVAVDKLFFPAGHLPPLGHEYQFNLDDPAGKEALQRLTGFLEKHAQ